MGGDGLDVELVKRKAWDAVANECPRKKGAEAHRNAASPLVHVTPLGHPSDVRCVRGEEVGAYPGFYRPVGGYADVAPVDALEGAPMERRARKRATEKNKDLACSTYKTTTYLMAEMTGR